MPVYYMVAAAIGSYFFISLWTKKNQISILYVGNLVIASMMVIGTCMFAGFEEPERVTDYNYSSPSSNSSAYGSSSSYDEMPSDDASVAEWDAYYDSHPEEAEKYLNEVMTNLQDEVDLQKAIDAYNGN